MPNWLYFLSRLPQCQTCNTTQVDYRDYSCLRYFLYIIHMLIIPDNVLMQYHFYMVLIKGVKPCYFIFQDGTENLNDIYI